jgi:insecticidal toxin complex protein TccC
MNASVHWRTPSVAVSDPRGLPVRQVDYLRTVPGGDVTRLIARQCFDAAARLVEQRDPRLFASAGKANLSTVHTLDGQPLRIDSVDAGRQLTLPDSGGQPVQRWDAHGRHWRSRYDPRLRLLSRAENAEPDSETFTYADASAAAGRNLRGQLIGVREPSGTLAFDSFSLFGQATGETRTFDDGQAWRSRQTFSPLGVRLEHWDAAGHCQQSGYDVAGQLQQLRLRLAGHTDWQAVLVDAQYSASGQISRQTHGNAVVCHWHYDPADGRLLQQRGQKPGEPPLQDFEYVYDRVGNVSTILDHAFTPRYFANQRIDGQRTFTYDSLYRLSSASGHADAPPSDHPARPQPSDPNDRRNYLERYAYDAGNNLIKTTHVRDGASHTREMFIDPASNRGVRWQPGDPPPDFASLFDRAGNLLAVQPGRPLRWDSRGQLQTVTLIDRGGSGDDQESYRYSQGARVCKRHETHTGKTRHFHQVRYLDNLQIRTRDNGEELHVITLAAGVGTVSCLHWVSGRPAEIDADQLRYVLTDHLGSALTELGGQAQLISQERYLPFGGTAVLTARSQLEVSYKTVRYSGKEMDVSRFYYYGARYYADWLQRWISADPAGAGDGLNLYAFVGNQPLAYVDAGGNARAHSVIMLYAQFIAAVDDHAGQTLEQLHNIIAQKNIVSSLLSNLAGEVLRGIAGYEGGVIGGGQFDLAFPGSPFTTPYTTGGGLIGGNIGGDVAGALADPPANSMGLSVGPLIPQTSQISVSAIDSSLGISDAVKEINTWRDVKDELIHPVLDSVLNPEFLMNRVMASWISIIPASINLFARAVEAEDIKNRLDPVKIDKIDTLLADWKSAIEQRWAWAEAAFDALGRDTIYPAQLLPNVNHMTAQETLAPITRSALQQQTRGTLANIAQAQRGLAAYKEMGTTDNQFLRRQAHPVASRRSTWFSG